MGTIFDYLDWRGDIPFAQVPLNPVDALILSTLAYDKLQIGTLQIQGFPALTKSEKQKMSYHITPKAVCGYPASGFFAWIA